MVGEIGGSAEEEAAEYIKSNVPSPLYPILQGLLLLKAKEWGMQVPL